MSGTEIFAVVVFAVIAYGIYRAVKWSKSKPNVRK